MAFSLHLKPPRNLHRTHEIDMTTGPLLGKIVAFAIPLCLSGVLQLLFNAADIVVVGRFAGPNALAAVGATGALINLIVNLFIGLSIGANVLAAQAFGAGNKKSLEETVHTAVLSSMVFGCILLVIGITLAKPLLEMMATPPEVMDQAVLYMRIFFLGMPASMLYNFGAAILRAVGDTRRPLFFLIVAGFVNVLMNLLFVIVFHMDVAGVATATVISQCISAGLVFLCLMREQGDYRLNPRKLRIHWKKLWGMAKIGMPAGVQGASFSISNVMIQSSINAFGAAAMAGNTAAANIEGFVSMGMDGFNQAALSFTAQNVGAKKPRRLGRVLLCCMVLVEATGLIMGVCGYLFGETLLGIYTSDPEVISYGLERMSVVCVLQCVGGLMGVFVGTLRGMGASLFPMIITISCVCGFRVVWILTVFAASPDLHTLYMSYPITWGLAAILEVVCWVVTKKRYEKKVSEELAQNN